MCLNGLFGCQPCCKINELGQPHETPEQKVAGSNPARRTNSKFCKGLHCSSIAATSCGAFAAQAKGLSSTGARFNFESRLLGEARDRSSLCHWTHILMLGGLLGRSLWRFHLDLKTEYPYATIADVDWERMERPSSGELTVSGDWSPAESRPRSLPTLQ